jgi:hypothetical protein
MKPWISGILPGESGDVLRITVVVPEVPGISPMEKFNVGAKIAVILETTKYFAKKMRSLSNQTVSCPFFLVTRTGMVW